MIRMQTLKSDSTISHQNAGDMSKLTFVAIRSLQVSIRKRLSVSAEAA